MEIAKRSCALCREDKASIEEGQNRRVNVQINEKVRRWLSGIEKKKKGKASGVKIPSTQSTII